MQESVARDKLLAYLTHSYVVNKMKYCELESGQGKRYYFIGPICTLYCECEEPLLVMCTTDLDCSLVTSRYYFVVKMRLFKPTLHVRFHKRIFFVLL
jgi:hypothetical protein